MNRTFWTVILSATLFVGAACLADDLQNRQLLETLPRDRRESLAANLMQFDRLGPTDQTAVRDLDRTISETDAFDQARYRALLQHYHLWFQGLSDEQRDQLLAVTDLTERFALARKFRLAEKLGPKRDGPRVAQIRTGEFLLMGPYEAVYLLRYWRDLTPDKRSELEKKPVPKLVEDLRAQAKAAKVHLDRFTSDQEKQFDQKLEANPEFKPLLEAFHKGDQTPRKADAARKAENVQKRFEHPFAEFLYFEENRPKPVSDPVRLERFAESCPAWFHTMTDPLSADDARDYYTILYRLFYPTGEMPEPARATRGAPAPATKRQQPAKPDPGGAAF